MVGHGYAKIEYGEIEHFTVGGIPIIVGRITGVYKETDGSESAGPVIYGAALGEHDLHNEVCGYGTTQAEAVADLFRLMRR